MSDTPARITVIFVTNNAKQVEADADSNLLRVSLREQGGIPFKCGAGLCGTCRCLIEHGIEHTAAVTARERKHLTDQDIAAGYRMACQTFVSGDVSVSWATRPAKP
jgi:ferredoxin